MSGAARAAKRTRDKWQKHRLGCFIRTYLRFLQRPDPWTPASTGLRANGAAALLRQEGRDAFALAGGLAAWVQDGQVLIPGPQR